MNKITMLKGLYEALNFIIEHHQIKIKHIQLKDIDINPYEVQIREENKEILKENNPHLADNNFRNSVLKDVYVPFVVSKTEKYYMLKEGYHRYEIINKEFSETDTVPCLIINSITDIDGFLLKYISIIQILNLITKDINPKEYKCSWINYNYEVQ